MRASNAYATAVELLDRYPGLTRPELDLLVAIFPKLSALDVALLLSDEAIGPKLDAFRRENASRIRTPFREYAVLIAIAVVGLVVTIWAVSMG